jgi:predicted dehydrogenase
MEVISMLKYAFVGASIRGIEMYAIPMSKSYPDEAEIVGVFDTNHKRAAILQKRAGGNFPVFTSFEEMINGSKPDIVIVTTMDRYHHEYVIKSLEAGCDVIVEKPMTIDADKCKAIMEAEQRTGRRITVTFNYRFAPFATRVKELIKEGSIGKILSIHFEWFLDTRHGADYFRRWHRKKENSGGLLVHKATHHFDYINWLLEEDPEIINAFGTRRFYGPTRDERGERCLTCEYKDSCEFFFNIREGEYKSLYHDCEDVDGYFRDRCVFSEEIDIEDSMSVCVKYSGGALMSYSLTAHSPYEGYKMSINGSDGRIEAEDLHGAIGPYAGEQIYKLRIYNRQGEEVNVKIPKITGVHGGGDERLLKMLMDKKIPDPLGKMADSRAGAMSIIIGIAANESIKQGSSIFIRDILKCI